MSLITGFPSNSKYTKDLLKSKKIIVKETIYWEIKLFDGCTPLEFQERSSYLSWNSKS